MDLFVYGTLAVPEIYERVTGNTPTLKPCILENYKRVKLKERLYPGIVKALGNKVNGYLIEELNDKDRFLVHEYEGFEYQTETLTVHINGNIKNAVGYVLSPEFTHICTNEAWTIEWFLKNHLQTYLNIFLG